MIEQNITCPACRFRHPASRSCAEAKRLADEAREARRAAERDAPDHYEIFNTFSITREAMRKLEPHVRAAAEEEWESGRVHTELANFANQLRARLQHLG